MNNFGLDAMNPMASMLQNGQQINIGKIAEKFGINEETFNEFVQKFAPQIAAAAELDIQTVQKAIPLVGKLIYSKEPVVDSEGNINITQDELKIIVEIALPFVGEYFGIPPQITNLVSPQLSEMVSNIAINYINPNEQTNGTIDENKSNSSILGESVTGVISNSLGEGSLQSEEDLSKKKPSSLWNRNFTKEKKPSDTKQVGIENTNEEQMNTTSEEKKEEQANNNIASNLSTTNKPITPNASLDDEKSKNVFISIEDREFINKARSINAAQNEMEKRDNMNKKFELASEECRLEIKQEPIKLLPEGFKFLATKAAQGLLNVSSWVKEDYYDYKAKSEQEENSNDEFLVNTNENDEYVQAIDPKTGEIKDVFKKEQNVKTLHGA